MSYNIDMREEDDTSDLGKSRFTMTISEEISLGILLAWNQTKRVHDKFGDSADEVWFEGLGVIVRDIAMGLTPLVPSETDFFNMLTSKVGVMCNDSYNAKMIDLSKGIDTTDGWDADRNRETIEALSISADLLIKELDVSDKIKDDIINAKNQLDTLGVATNLYTVTMAMWGYILLLQACAKPLYHSRKATVAVDDNNVIIVSEFLEGYNVFFDIGYKTIKSDTTVH